MIPTPSTQSVLLLGTGSSIPDRVYRNEDFPAELDTSDQWIFTRTGIRERRIADPSETSLTLAIKASQEALAAAGRVPNDIDLIVCATVSPDRICPANANLLQSRLGCRTIPSFDLSAACSGFLYALAVGDQFIRGGMARTILVVGAETLSRIIDYRDRTSCILFGDGAGAAVLEAHPEPGRGLRNIRLHSDGSPAELIQVPGTVPRSEFFPPVRPGASHYMTLNGREVYRFAVRCLSQILRDATEWCERCGEEIALLIPHQVNQRIIDAALDETGFPAAKVVSNLDRVGNTAAASVPIALDEAIRTGRARTGDTILLAAFGGGLTWGSALLTL